LRVAVLSKRVELAERGLMARAEGLMGIAQQIQLHRGFIRVFLGRLQIQQEVGERRQEAAKGPLDRFEMIEA
jgi:hypothetical protein